MFNLAGVMSFKRNYKSTKEMKETLFALDKSQAVIHFELDGTIIDANDNFLSVMGYTLAEVRGKHHSMFAEAGVADTRGYKAFWRNLAAGNFDSG